MFYPLVLILIGLTQYTHSSEVFYVDDEIYCDEITLVYPDPNTQIPSETIRIDKIEFLYNASIFDENLVSITNLKDSIKQELLRRFLQNLTLDIEIFHDITNSQWLLKTSFWTSTSESGDYELNYNEFIRLINSKTWKENIAQIAANNGMTLNLAVEEAKITVIQDLISESGSEKLTVCYYEGYTLLSGNCDYVFINLETGDQIVSTQVPELTPAPNKGVNDYTFIIDWKADQLALADPESEDVRSGLINGLPSTSILNAIIGGWWDSAGHSSFVNSELSYDPTNRVWNFRTIITKSGDLNPITIDILSRFMSYTEVIDRINSLAVGLDIKFRYDDENMNSTIIETKYLSNGNMMTNTCFYAGLTFIRCEESISSTSTANPLKSSSTTTPSENIQIIPQSTTYFYSLTFNMIGIPIKTSKNSPISINGNSMFGLENSLRNVWWEATTYDSNVKNLFNVIESSQFYLIDSKVWKSSVDEPLNNVWTVDTLKKIINTPSLTQKLQNEASLIGIELILDLSQINSTSNFTIVDSNGSSNKTICKYVGGILSNNVCLFETKIDDGSPQITFRSLEQLSFGSRQLPSLFLILFSSFLAVLVLG